MRGSCVWVISKSVHVHLQYLVTWVTLVQFPRCIELFQVILLPSYEKKLDWNFPMKKLGLDICVNSDLPYVYFKYFSMQGHFECFCLTLSSKKLLLRTVISLALSANMAQKLKSQHSQCAQTAPKRTQNKHTVDIESNKLSNFHHCIVYLYLASQITQYLSQKVFFSL